MNTIKIISGPMAGREGEFLTMQAACRAGRISVRAYVAAVGLSYVQDATGVVWLLDGQVFSWRWWDGRQWLEGRPPFLETLPPMEQPPPPPPPPPPFALHASIPTSPTKPHKHRSKRILLFGLAAFLLIGMVAISYLAFQSGDGIKIPSFESDSNPIPAEGENVPPAPHKRELSLSEALWLGNTEQIEKWVKDKKRLEEPGPDGLTPLQEAAFADQPGAVMKLLELGANPDVKDLLGRTPLEQAVESNDVTSVEALLKVSQGVDVGALLFLAVDSGAKLTMEFLLNTGATVKTTDAQGLTALHHAARRGHEFVIQPLIDKGAETGATNTNGETPLHLTARFNRLNVVRLLLNNGVSLDIKDNEGQTALYVAAENGAAEIIHLLLEAGADPGLSGPNGIPATIALERGNIPAWKALAEK